MSKGSSSQSTASSQQYTPAALSDIQSLYQRILGTSNTPYAPYDPNAMVAPQNAGQTQAIGNIENAASANGGQGIASPFITQASQYASAGSNPILQTNDAIAQQLFGQNFADLSPAQQQQASSKQSDPISRYYNPFQSDVINSTMANIQQNNTLERQQLQGNSASQGGLGNERFYAAALPELARKQNLATNQTLAGLNSQNYSQALSAAQADRAASSSGANLFANLGTTAQQNAIGGNQAALQAGSTTQQTAQQQANANLQEFMRAQGYPFQTTQFLAGLGLPALQAQGGTQAGTSSSSGSSSSGGIGSAFSLLGGLFGANGGRVRMADGGDPTRLPFMADRFSTVPVTPEPKYIPHPFSNMGGSGGGGPAAQSDGKEGKALSDMLKKFRSKQMGGQQPDGTGQSSTDNASPLSGNPDYTGTSPDGTTYPTADAFGTGMDTYDSFPGSDAFGVGMDSYDTSSAPMDTGSMSDFGGMGDFGGFAANGGEIGKPSEHIMSILDAAHHFRHGLRKMSSGGTVKGYKDGASVDEPGFLTKLRDVMRGYRDAPAMPSYDETANGPPFYPWGGQSRSRPSVSYDETAGAPNGYPWGLGGRGRGSPTPDAGSPIMASAAMPMQRRLARMGGPMNPAMGLQLGMRPNEVAGFNEATGAYEPRNNLWQRSPSMTSEHADMGEGEQEPGQQSSGMSSGSASQGDRGAPVMQASGRGRYGPYTQAFYDSGMADAPGGTGLLARMSGAPQARARAENLLRQMNADIGSTTGKVGAKQFSIAPATLPNGMPVIIRNDGLAYDPSTGQRVTDTAVKSTRGSRTLEAAQALMQSNPGRFPSLEDAYQFARKAPEDPAHAAGVFARADIGYIGNDPVGTLNKWRRTFGLPPLTAEQAKKEGVGSSNAAPADVALPHVTTKAERDALPAGKKYIGPDGKTYEKQ